MIRKILIWLPLALVITSCSLPTALQAGTENLLSNQEKRDYVKVVYPKDNSTIFAPSTFLVGSIAPQTNLTCNDVVVNTNSDGFFAHIVQLKPGDNEFALKSNNIVLRTIHIIRGTAVSPLDPNKFQVDKNSPEPKESLGLITGDTILLALRATPGSNVCALLGQRKIKLAAANKAHLNVGADYSYGACLQNSPAADPALYLGLYRISTSDIFHKSPVKYVIEKNNYKSIITSAGTVSTIAEPLFATTLHSDTIVRLGPGKARVTPLPDGVKLIVDGTIGEFVRCKLAADHHVFILQKDVQFNNDIFSAPNTVIRTVNVNEDSGGAVVSIPLNQRLPYQIEQQLSPNKLILRIFGVTSDTDWITQSPKTSSVIDHLAWRQPSDQIYELTIHIQGKRQWGYWANYADNTLEFHIKSPPSVLSNQSPLAGITICLDPGHGGTETGAIGPSGIEESQVNLSIALKLRDLLTADGAKVIMTRQTNTNYLSLADRVQVAINNKSDILISIHNNALPDGRDPIAEHGTSTYWYHPQSLELAQKLRQALIHQIKFADFGTFYQNLALIRPSNMPSVLVEVGFMINPDEYSQLITSATQSKIAQGLEDGIISYFK